MKNGLLGYFKTFAILALTLSADLYAQNALLNGVPQAGTIPDANGQSSWEVNVSKGERFTILLSETAGGAGFNPRLEVFDTGGRIIGTDFGTTGARLDLAAEVAGNYLVRVVDNNLTGTGGFSILQVSPAAAFSIPSGDDGGTLPNGQAVAASITPGDIDHWTVDAVAGDRLIFQIAETAGGASFGPRMEIFTPDGQVLASKTDTLAARADIQVPTSGRYSVIVSDKDETGSGSATTCSQRKYRRL